MFLKNQKQTINNHKFAIICFIISFIISIIASLYGTFCDEPDIITASWLMKKGYILYKDIFCHHMPFPYFFLLPFHFFSQNIVVLRIVFSILTQLYFVFLYLFFYKKISKKIFPILSIFWALSKYLTYQNMILSESFIAIGLFTIFIEIIINPELNFTKKDQIIISLSTIISLGSSLIAIYPLMIFYIYYIVPDKKDRAPMLQNKYQKILILLNLMKYCRILKNKNKHNKLIFVIFCY